MDFVNALGINLLVSGLLVLIWFEISLVEFYGISTLVGYLMPNPVYRYLWNILELF